jgi:hypothetical protein
VKIRHGRNKVKTSPLRSLRLLGVKMLTYLVAMTNPRKHITNTFAMGKTANFSILKTDSESFPIARIIAGGNPWNIGIRIDLFSVLRW